MYGIPESLKLIVANGAAFSYLEDGAGPTTIVFLHGVGSGARSWQGQLSGLSDSYRVIAWDAPGYGGSTPLVREQPDAGDYTARLASFLDKLKADRFHLVGHSLGAIIAARFALEHPDRVLSLSLAGPSAGHARLPLAERDRLRNARLDDLSRLGVRGMAEMRGPRLLSPETSEQLKRTVIETMALVRLDGYRQAVNMLSVSDTQGDIVQLPIKLPLQFIVGEHDVVVPPEGTAALATARPDVSIHTVKQTGHAMYLEKPECFNNLLKSFMNAAVSAHEMAR